MDPIKIEGAWPKASWKPGQLFSVFAGNDRYCHPADGIFDNNILCYLFIRVSLQKWLSNKGNQLSQIASVYQLHYHLCSATSLVTDCYYKIYNLTFMKVSTPENYPSCLILGTTSWLVIIEEAIVYETQTSMAIDPMFHENLAWL